MKFFLLILCTLLFIACSGQEKLSIYFKSGHSKIDQKLSQQIDQLASKYVLSDLDSVVFIGFADSIGNYKANLKLSEKRARNAASYFKKEIPEKTPISIRFKGEKNKQIETKDRRVDIVLYFPEVTEAEIEIENPGKTETIKVPKCYYVNYTLLAKCKKRNVIKGKKKFISLETYYLPHKSIINYYGSTNQKGEFVHHKIKWSKKIVYVSKKKYQTIYYTLIPEDEFKKYEVFLMADEPCTICGEKFNSTTERKTVDSCIVLDELTSNTVEIKRSSTNKSLVKMRIPASSFDSVNHYFLLRNPKLKINWVRGKGNKKDYLFANAPMSFDRKVNKRFIIYGEIYKKAKCCIPPPDTGIGDNWNYDQWYKLYCGFGNGNGYLKKNTVVGLEIGNNFHQDSCNQYAAISIMKENFNVNKGILLGIDIRKKFYTAIRYQYHFFTFKYSSLNPFYKWRKPDYLPIENKLFGRFYLGSELRSGKNQLNQNFIESNAHAGFASIYKGRIYLRGFAQYGIGYDYLRNNSKKPYPVFQMGITWQFLGF